MKNVKVRFFQTFEQPGHPIEFSGTPKTAPKSGPAGHTYYDRIRNANKGQPMAIIIFVITSDYTHIHKIEWNQVFLSYFGDTCQTKSLSMNFLWNFARMCEFLK